jgi:hypothetical protein
MVGAMLVLRVFAAASIVIAAAGCAKGSEGPIGSGGSVGDGGSNVMTTGSNGNGGSGGAPSVGGGSPSGSTTSSSTDASSSSTSNPASSSSTGAGGCSGAHLYISQVQSRGTAGGNDDFVELFNPTAMDVTLDSSWELLARSQSTSSYGSRWKGTGKTIPSGGHYLLVGSAYNGGVGKDGDLTSGVSDASSVLLQHSGSDIDYLCFGFTGSDTFGGTFKCHGSPADNAPHDNTTSGASNSDASIERKNNGCAYTGDDAADFHGVSPSDPHNHAN